MAPTPIRQLARHVDYDAARRRLWIAGQRCHHGATGTLLATTGVVVLGARVARRGAFAIAAAGAALMAHDWKDRGVWFERGRGSQD